MINIANIEQYVGASQALVDLRCRARTRPSRRGLLGRGPKTTLCVVLGPASRVKGLGGLRASSLARLGAPGLHDSTLT